MRRNIRRLLALVAVAPLALTQSATAQAWYSTVKENTLSGYAQFALQYPGSRYARVAHSRLVTGGELTGAFADKIAEETGPESAPEFTPDSIMVV